MMILDSSVDRFLLTEGPHVAGHLPFLSAHPPSESATRLLAHPGGRLALSLLLAGINLPRRYFAPCIPPERTNRPVQQRNLG